MFFSHTFSSSAPIGISTKNQEQIFDRFIKLNTFAKLCTKHSQVQPTTDNLLNTIEYAIKSRHIPIYPGTFGRQSGPTVMEEKQLPGRSCRDSRGTNSSTGEYQRQTSLMVCLSGHFLPVQVIDRTMFLRNNSTLQGTTCHGGLSL